MFKKMLSIAIALILSQLSAVGVMAAPQGRVFVGAVPQDVGWNAIGGYKAADALCGAAYRGSVVCSVQEIIESLRLNKFPIEGFDGATVNSGATDINSPNNADCHGWTGDGKRVGFNFDPADYNLYFLMVSGTCGGTGDFACCK